MTEYRIQSRHGDEWHFITDRNGHPYTYLTLATAWKFGLQHAPRYWDGTRWEPNMDTFRIVYADIDWIVVS